MAAAILDYMSKNQVLFIIPFCMLGGAFLRLRGFLVTEDTETLSKVTFNFFLPVIILIALATAELSLDLWRVLVSSLATQILAGVVVLVVVKTIFRSPELKGLRGNLIISCMAADIGFTIPMVLGSGLKDSFVALVIWDLPFNAMTGLMFNRIIGVLHSPSSNDESEGDLEKPSDDSLPTVGIVGPGQGVTSKIQDDVKVPTASHPPAMSPRLSPAAAHPVKNAWASPVESFTLSEGSCVSLAARRRQALRQTLRQSIAEGTPVEALAPLAVGLTHRATIALTEDDLVQSGGSEVIGICLAAMKGMAKDINIICMFIAFVINSTLMATDTKHEFPTFLKTSLFSVGAGFGTLLYVILGLNFRIQVMMPHLKVAVPLLLARTFLYSCIGVLLFVTGALPNKAAMQAAVVALLAPVNAPTVGIAIDCGLDWELQTTVMLLSMLLSSVLLAVASAFMTA